MLTSRQNGVHSRHNNKNDSLTNNWDFLDNLSLSNLKSNNDQTLLKELASKIIKSSELPNGNPQRLQKLFSLSQIILNSSKRINSKAASQIHKNKSEIEKLKKSIQEIKDRPPGVKCPVCLISFRSIDFLDSHISKKHPNFIDSWKFMRTPQTQELNIQPAQPVENINTILDELKSELQKTQQANENKIMDFIAQKMSNFETNIDEKMDSLRADALAQTLPNYENQYEVPYDNNRQNSQNSYMPAINNRRQKNWNISTYSRKRNAPIKKIQNNPNQSNSSNQSNNPSFFEFSPNPSEDDDNTHKSNKDYFSDEFEPKNKRKNIDEDSMGLNIPYISSSEPKKAQVTPPATLGSQIQQQDQNQPQKHRHHRHHKQDDQHSDNTNDDNNKGDKSSTDNKNAQKKKIELVFQQSTEIYNNNDEIVNINNHKNEGIEINIDPHQSDSHEKPTNSIQLGGSMNSFQNSSKEIKNPLTISANISINKKQSEKLKTLNEEKPKIEKPSLQISSKSVLLDKPYHEQNNDNPKNSIPSNNNNNNADKSNINSSINDEEIFQSPKMLSNSNIEKTKERSVNLSENNSHISRSFRNQDDIAAKASKKVSKLLNIGSASDSESSDSIKILRKNVQPKKTNNEQSKEKQKSRLQKYQTRNKYNEDTSESEDIKNNNNKNRRHNSVLRSRKLSKIDFYSPSSSIESSETSDRHFHHRRSRSLSRRRRRRHEYNDYYDDYDYDDYDYSDYHKTNAKRSHKQSRNVNASSRNGKKSRNHHERKQPESSKSHHSRNSLRRNINNLSSESYSSDDNKYKKTNNAKSKENKLVISSSNQNDNTSKSQIRSASLQISEDLSKLDQVKEKFKPKLRICNLIIPADQPFMLSESSESQDENNSPIQTPVSHQKSTVITPSSKRRSHSHSKPSKSDKNSNISNNNSNNQSNQNKSKSNISLEKSPKINSISSDGSSLLSYEQQSVDDNETDIKENQKNDDENISQNQQLLSTNSYYYYYSSSSDIDKLIYSSDTYRKKRSESSKKTKSSKSNNSHIHNQQQSPASFISPVRNSPTTPVQKIQEVAKKAKEQLNNTIQLTSKNRKNNNSDYSYIPSGLINDSSFDRDIKERRMLLIQKKNKSKNNVNPSNEKKNEKKLEKIENNQENENKNRQDKNKINNENEQEKLPHSPLRSTKQSRAVRPNKKTPPKNQVVDNNKNLFNETFDRENQDLSPIEKNDSVELSSSLILDAITKDIPSLRNKKDPFNIEENQYSEVIESDSNNSNIHLGSNNYNQIQSNNSKRPSNATNLKLKVPISPTNVQEQLKQNQNQQQKQKSQQPEQQHQQKPQKNEQQKQKVQQPEQIQQQQPKPQKPEQQQKQKTQEPEKQQKQEIQQQQQQQKQKNQQPEQQQNKQKQPEERKKYNLNSDQLNEDSNKSYSENSEQISYMAKSPPHKFHINASPRSKNKIKFHLESESSSSESEEIKLKSRNNNNNKNINEKKKVPSPTESTKTAKNNSKQSEPVQPKKEATPEQTQINESKPINDESAEYNEEEESFKSEASIIDSGSPILVNQENKDDNKPAAKTDDLNDLLTSSIIYSDGILVEDNVQQPNLQPVIKRNQSNKISANTKLSLDSDKNKKPSSNEDNDINDDKNVSNPFTIDNEIEEEEEEERNEKLKKDDRSKKEFQFLLRDYSSDDNLPQNDKISNPPIQNTKEKELDSNQAILIHSEENKTQENDGNKKAEMAFTVYSASDEEYEKENEQKPNNQPIVLALAEKEESEEEEEEEVEVGKMETNKFAIPKQTEDSTKNEAENDQVKNDVQIKSSNLFEMSDDVTNIGEEKDKSNNKEDENENENEKIENNEIVIHEEEEEEGQISDNKNEIVNDKKTDIVNLHEDSKNEEESTENNEDMTQFLEDLSKGNESINDNKEEIVQNQEKENKKEEEEEKVTKENEIDKVQKEITPAEEKIIEEEDEKDEEIAIEEEGQNEKEILIEKVDDFKEEEEEKIEKVISHEKVENIASEKEAKMEEEEDITDDSIFDLDSIKNDKEINFEIKDEAQNNVNEKEEEESVKEEVKKEEKTKKEETKKEETKKEEAPINNDKQSPAASPKQNLSSEPEDVLPLNDDSIDQIQPNHFEEEDLYEYVEEEETAHDDYDATIHSRFAEESENEYEVESGTSPHDKGKGAEIVIEVFNETASDNETFSYASKEESDEYHNEPSEKHSLHEESNPKETESATSIQSTKESNQNDDELTKQLQPIPEENKQNDDESTKQLQVTPEENKQNEDESTKQLQPIPEENKQDEDESTKQLQPIPEENKQDEDESAKQLQTIPEESTQNEEESPNQLQAIPEEVDQKENEPENKLETIKEETSPNKVEPATSTISKAPKLTLLRPSTLIKAENTNNNNDNNNDNKEKEGTPQKAEVDEIKTDKFDEEQVHPGDEKKEGKSEVSSPSSLASNEPAYKHVSDGNEDHKEEEEPNESPFLQQNNENEDNKQMFAVSDDLGSDEYMSSNSDEFHFESKESEQKQEQLEKVQNNQQKSQVVLNFESRMDNNEEEEDEGPIKLARCCSDSIMLFQNDRDGQILQISSTCITVPNPQSLSSTDRFYLDPNDYQRPNQTGTMQPMQPMQQQQQQQLQQPQVQIQMQNQLQQNKQPEQHVETQFIQPLPKPNSQITQQDSLNQIFPFPRPNNQRKSINKEQIKETQSLKSLKQLQSQNLAEQFDNENMESAPSMLTMQPLPRPQKLSRNAPQIQANEENNKDQKQQKDDKMDSSSTSIMYDSEGSDKEDTQIPLSATKSSDLSQSFKSNRFVNSGQEIHLNANDQLMPMRNNSGTISLKDLNPLNNGSTTFLQNPNQQMQLLQQQQQMQQEQQQQMQLLQQQHQKHQYQGQFGDVIEEYEYEEDEGTNYFQQQGKMQMTGIPLNQINNQMQLQQQQQQQMGRFGSPLVPMNEDDEELSNDQLPSFQKQQKTTSGIGGGLGRPGGFGLPYQQQQQQQQQQQMQQQMQQQQMQQQQAGIGRFGGLSAKRIVPGLGPALQPMEEELPSSLQRVPGLGPTLAPMNSSSTRSSFNSQLGMSSSASEQSQQRPKGISKAVPFSKIMSEGNMKNNYGMSQILDDEYSNESSGIPYMNSSNQLNSKFNINNSGMNQFNNGSNQFNNSSGMNQFNNSNMNQFNNGMNQLNSNMNQFNNGMNQFGNNSNQLNANKFNNSNMNQFNNGNNQFNSNMSQFNNGNNQFNSNMSQFNNGNNQFNSNMNQFNSSSQFNNANNQQRPQSKGGFTVSSGIGKSNLKAGQSLLAPMNQQNQSQMSENIPLNSSYFGRISEESFEDQTQQQQQPAINYGTTDTKSFSQIRPENSFKPQENHSSTVKQIPRMQSISMQELEAIKQQLGVKQQSQPQQSQQQNQLNQQQQNELPPTGNRLQRAQRFNAQEMPQIMQGSNINEISQTTPTGGTKLSSSNKNGGCSSGGGFTVSSGIGRPLQMHQEVEQQADSNLIPSNENEQVEQEPEIEAPQVPVVHDMTKKLQRSKPLGSVELPLQMFEDDEEIAKQISLINSMNQQNGEDDSGVTNTIPFQAPPFFGQGMNSNNNTSGGGGFGLNGSNSNFLSGNSNNSTKSSGFSVVHANGQKDASQQQNGNNQAPTKSGFTVAYGIQKSRK